MIHEYALDPEVLRDWAGNDRDYAEFLREYGLGTPRIFSSFPKMKKNKIRTFFFQSMPVDQQSLAALRYTEMVTKFTEDLVIREPELTGSASWPEYVVNEDARLPFSVILSKDRVDSERCITPSNMHAPGGLWSHVNQLNIQRTNDSLCRGISNLLRFASEHVVVIDAYGWTTEAINQMQHFIKVISCDRLNSNLPKVTLFFKESRNSACANHVKQQILLGTNSCKLGIKIEVIVLEEIPGSDVFHNRCIMTEHGGVLIGHGIGVSGVSAHTDEIVLMNSTLYQKKWKQFMGDGIFQRISQA